MRERLKNAFFEARYRLAILRWRLRAPFGVRFGAVAVTIAAICVGTFVVQQIAGRVYFIGNFSFGLLLTNLFGLHWPFVAAGFFWQPLTYNFLHGSWAHLLLNLFSLLFFGSAVEYLVGKRRFWFLFLLSGVIGGIGWMLFDAFEPLLWQQIQRLPSAFWGHLAQQWAEQQPIGRFGVCIGASAGIFGLIGAFAALCPQRELIILLLFVPLKMRARQLALLLMCVTLVELVVGRGQIAYAAHLFGGLSGFGLARRWRRRLQIQNDF